MSNHKNVPVKPATKERVEQLKQESNAESYDEFVVDLLNDNLEVSLEEIEVEQNVEYEKVERTRATVVAILESANEFSITDDVIDIVKNLSKQDMLGKNQEIIDHLFEKAKKGESLNEVDQLLAKVVMETEQGREVEQSPAAEIAQGLFSGTDTATAERRTSEVQKVSEEEKLTSEESDGGNEAEMTTTQSNTLIE